MSPDSIEQRLKLLEEKYENLEHENRRLQAVIEIQNLMGRYEAIHNITDVTRSWQFFARQTPDTWMEVSNWGIAEGFEEIKKVWEAMEPKEEIPAEGVLFEHPLATPIIEVAKDGKTAKAYWVSPGHETKPRDGKMTAHWCWGKYAVDFVKEDGQWRIWHFKWFRGFITPFDTSWVDRPREPELERHIVCPECNLKPSKYHRPYFPDQIAESLPAAPQPYETWTEEDKDWHLRPTEKV